MMTMALMGNVGMSIDKGKQKAGNPPLWGIARLGQCVILVEVLYKLHELSSEKLGNSVVGLHRNCAFTLLTHSV
jgi:hypothetical protein